MKNHLSRISRSASALVVGAGLSLASLAAHAELDAAITSQLASTKTDGIALGSAVLVVIIAIAAFKLLRRGV